MSARGGARLLGLLGLLALGLAAIGLYGLVSYMVGRRTREVGIRIALGAQRKEVFGQLVIEGLSLVAAGMAIGLVAAWGIAQASKSLLLEINPADPLAYVGACLLLLAVALCACSVPARRALRIDPMAALRYE